MDLRHRKGQAFLALVFLIGAIVAIVALLSRSLPIDSSIPAMVCPPRRAPKRPPLPARRTRCLSSTGNEFRFIRDTIARSQLHGIGGRYPEMLLGGIRYYSFFRVGAEPRKKDPGHSLRERVDVSDDHRLLGRSPIIYEHTTIVIPKNSFFAPHPFSCRRA